MPSNAWHGSALGARHCSLHDHRPACVLWAWLWLSLRNALQWRLPPVSRPWVTRFSSRSAQGRRRMGAGGRGVSICPATFGGIAALRLRTLNEIASPIVPRERRGSALSDGNSNALAQAAAQTCLPQRNSLPSAHMRCRITASLRATATRARAMPRRLATFMPHARNADHLELRISSEWAAS